MGKTTRRLVILLSISTVALVVFNVIYLQNAVKIEEGPGNGVDTRSSPTTLMSVGDGTTLSFEKHLSSSTQSLGRSKNKKNKKKNEATQSKTQQHYAATQNKKNAATDQEQTNAVDYNSDKNHVVSGLDCTKYGGPSNNVAAEMIYWNDIPTDAVFTSPYSQQLEGGGDPTPPTAKMTTENNEGSWNIPDDAKREDPKYLSFEPDEGGWNNIRMSMETAVTMAHAMGRILVLPPMQRMYLLWSDKKNPKNNQFTFKDFFHLDSIEREHPSVEIITMEEYLVREAMTGKLRNGNPYDNNDKQEGRNASSTTTTTTTSLSSKTSQHVYFPPDNRTNWDGANRKEARPLWLWLRQAVPTPKWDPQKCILVFPQQSGAESANAMKEFRSAVARRGIGLGAGRNPKIGQPTPVDAPTLDRLKEVLGKRNHLCIYDEAVQQAKVLHMTGDNASGARLLIHFYAFLFFDDWHHDLWTKRFVRDHLRYIDEIQCTAAKIIQAVRQKAREHNGVVTTSGEGADDATALNGGVYDSFHIRRGDFQYVEQTRVEADVIYDNVKDVLVENSTIFIATDEKNASYFEPLERHYNIYYLRDFKHLLEGLNVNYFGMVDQLVASRGRTFVGAYYSTFTGYINRLRGYHSQKDRLPGYEMGELNSYFYMPRYLKHDIRQYTPIREPMWSREFPIAWRDIDHDVVDLKLTSSGPAMA